MTEIPPNVPSTEVSTSPSPTSAPPVARVGGVLRWLRDLVISAAVSIFIIIFVYQPVKVEGTSMMPGLDDQEAIADPHG